jgi:predicted DsbA family dithiol-disulfide isomerase
MRADVRAWVDPSCPWAWQTVRWLLELRERRLVDLSWSLFSLEVNSSPPGIPFAEAATRHGASLVALALAREEGGSPAFEALYRELGTRLHDAKIDPSVDLVRSAAADAGLEGLVDRASARPELGDALVEEHREARALDVFGVPTLAIDGCKVVYGPIVANAPTGDHALALWDVVRGFAQRDDLFELKRWPRDVRPGELPRPSAP